MKEIVKKCSSDQRFTLKEITFNKIHTLAQIHWWFFYLQAIKSPPIVNNGKSAVLNKVPNEKLKLHQPKAEEFKANWDEPIKGEM